MSAEQKPPVLLALDEVEQGPRNVVFQSVREAAREQIRELPFPTPRTEDWRFTSVAPILQTRFEPAARGTTVEEADLPAPLAQDAVRLTFINGWFSARHSRIGELPRGCEVGNLANATLAQTLRLARIAGNDGQVFTALNTALLRDGAFLLLADRTALERPVEFLYVVRDDGKKLAITPRSLIVLGENCRATVVERFVTAPGVSEAYFTNAVTEVAVGPGAALDHCKVQQEALQANHIANTQAVLAQRANFRSHYIALGGALVRNEVRVRFDGTNAEATVNGLYFAAGTQHFDSYTVIDHAVPHCVSHELYKGVLADHAHGVFNGKIFVRQDAQKTDAKQTNQVLLLSDSATINTKPQLEMFADDVRCTHGATIGQLDAEQLFYLQSRGIELEQARRILTFAFANDIVSRISIEAIRDELEAILVNRNL